jgi:hypothetical protein
MAFHQDKYIYTVDLKYFEKCLTFQMRHLAEQKIMDDPFVRNKVADGFGTMIGIFPIEKINSKYKSIEFENKYYNLKKDMKNAGYSSLWPLHGVLEETQAELVNSMHHSHNRKQKQNQNSTKERKKILEDNSNSSTVIYVKGWLEAIVQYDRNTQCDIEKILEKHGFRAEFLLQFNSSKNCWLYEGNPVSEYYIESPLHPTYIDDEFNHLFHSLDQIKTILAQVSIYS